MSPRHPAPLRPDELVTPDWLLPLVRACELIEAEELSRFVPPADGSGRHSAVLMLFASGQGSVDDADLLLLERASTLRSHAGQVAFPGGATDPGDADSTETALREANEEVGLRRETVDVLAELPAVYLPPSRFVVSPVLAHWREPHPVGVVDHRESASVARVPLPALIDPANRFTVSHPSGFVGPGFEVAGLFVWGFTAGLIDRLLSLAGWAQPWDTSIARALPAG
ncbi:CoA pyrophosphatase [Jatrophihabitans telluris]|uniref:CoA pyrophosphatase n=1 Tax=Jatrophihabitans telluris TaxID=2038343 RepID=A0ABY4QX61_9ACTN|nr:CoA pyrophosphatase [Jatrophihabitans telluris]UQX88159.1 CoA pyrophosphatase [Jatrophihabitans telluris]